MLKRSKKQVRRLLTAALTAAAFSAEAADIYSDRGGSLKDAPDVVYSGPVNWTGFYLEANAGAAVNNNRTNYSYSYIPGSGTGNFSDFFLATPPTTPTVLVRPVPSTSTD